MLECLPLGGGPERYHLWHVCRGAGVLKDKVDVFGVAGCFPDLLGNHVEHESSEEHHIILMALLLLSFSDALLSPFSTVPLSDRSGEINSFNFTVSEL